MTSDAGLAFVASFLPAPRFPPDLRGVSRNSPQDGGVDLLSRPQVARHGYPTTGCGGRPPLLGGNRSNGDETTIDQLAPCRCRVRQGKEGAHRQHSAPALPGRPPSISRSSQPAGGHIPMRSEQCFVLLVLGARRRRHDACHRAGSIHGGRKGMTRICAAFLILALSAVSPRRSPRAAAVVARTSRYRQPQYRRAYRSTDRPHGGS